MPIAPTSVDLLPEPWLRVWSTADPAFEAALKAARASDAAFRRVALPALDATADLRQAQAFAERRLTHDLTQRDRAALRGLLWARTAMIERELEAALARTDLLMAAALLREWAKDLDVVRDCAARLRSGDAQGAAVVLVDLDIPPAARAAAQGAATPDEAAGPARRDEPDRPGLLPADLASALHQLVHPNRLGHRTVVFPDEPAAAVTVLRALAALTTTAAGLAADTGLRAGAARRAGRPGPVTTATPDQLTTLAGRVDEVLVDQGGEPHATAAVATLLADAAAADDRKADDLWPEVWAQIQGRLDAVGGWQDAPELGLPADPVHRVLNLSHARRLWRLLPTIEPLERGPGGTPLTAGSPAWLEYVRAELELATLLAGLRRAALTTSLIDALANSRWITAALAARGIVESDAAALYVAQQIEDARAMIARPGRLQAAAALAEKAVSRYLARGAEAESAGSPGRWAELNMATQQLSIESTLTSIGADPVQENGPLYAVLCAYVHGRLFRTSMSHPECLPVAVPCFQVLASYCDERWHMHVLSRLAHGVMWLEEYERTFTEQPPVADGDTDFAARLAQAARTRQRPSGTWHTGSHYTGTGTEHDPIRFVPAGDPVDHIYAWLAARSEHPTLSIAVQYDDGTTGRQVYTDKGDHWFSYEQADRPPGRKA